jgi:hypothetical protein
MSPPLCRPRRPTRRGKGRASSGASCRSGGVSAELTGRQILKLATKNGIYAITDDAAVRPSAYSNTQIWPSTAGTLWGPPPKSAVYPTIAVVDSGIDTLNSAFGEVASWRR